MKKSLPVLFLFSLLSFFTISVGSPQVSGPATIQLVSETIQVAPGQTFHLALDFKLEPHWHIYWKNPGASGFPVEIEWDLPEGFIPGEIQWPAPERIALGGLISYGFEDAVTLIIPVQAPEKLKPGAPVLIRAEVSWLICKEACLPGNASVSLELTSGEAAIESEVAPLFKAVGERLPKKSPPWQVAATIGDRALLFSITQADQKLLPDTLYFYADTEGVIDPNADQEFSFTGERSAVLRAPLALEQLDRPLSSFAGVLQSSDNSWYVEGTIVTEVGQSSISIVTLNDSGGIEASLLEIGLPGQLFLAFLGGLILNLMPCVLPVLSLKVFSLLKHTGQSRSQSLLYGSAYAVGVVASFLALAGLLLSLRSLGQQVGWGFQLQNPGFVAVLTILIFLLALNLMGVFEIGTSLVGKDAAVSSRHDIFGSFGMGVFAAVVGAPCIGPFLASVSGIALQEDTATCLLIFGVMGLGLASPFLLLSIFPKLMVYLPKPGAWMETLKQFMGFLLMATAVFLIYVSGTLGGTDAIIGLLSALLMTALAAWVYGRWSVPVKPKRIRCFAQMISIMILSVASFYAIREVNDAHHQVITNSTPEKIDGWVPWSAERVDLALSKGQPVFIDFTASWCLICQANKKLALRTEATQSLFEDNEIAAMTADWTRYDPEITKELERFGRSGVPLYLFYTPDGQVTILPQNLTNGKVREIIQNVLK